ncbi:MAG TPA: aminotransferase class I/II-fold pyridoxal phosphate-dependent enzyme, partial [Burkholderiaceae bacterium]
EALHEQVSFGVLGYPAGPARSYLEAVTGWQAKRFGWQGDPAWIVPTSGVIAALKTAIQAFTAPGDSVLIQPPVYVHFHEDVTLNGRRIAPAPLVLEDGRYRFDAASIAPCGQQSRKPIRQHGNEHAVAQHPVMINGCRRM